MIIELCYQEEIDLDANLSGQEDAASTEFSRLDIDKWTSSTASLIIELPRNFSTIPMERASEGRGCSLMDPVMVL